MLTIIQSYDTAILNLIQIYLKSAILDKIMPMVTFLGNNGLIWLGIALVLTLSKKYRHIGFLVCAALLLNLILGDYFLKNIIQRARPFINIDIQLLIPGPTSFSFPSGHTSSSFAAAGVLAKGFGKYRIYIFVLATLIAFSRMYLYVHYLTDIIGGIILGLICSKTVLFIYAYRVRKTAL